MSVCLLFVYLSVHLSCPVSVTSLDQSILHCVGNKVSFSSPPVHKRDMHETSSISRNQVEPVEEPSPLPLHPVQSKPREHLNCLKWSRCAVNMRAGVSVLSSCSPSPDLVASRDWLVMDDVRLDQSHLDMCFSGFVRRGGFTLVVFRCGAHWSVFRVKCSFRWRPLPHASKCVDVLDPKYRGTVQSFL